MEPILRASRLRKHYGTGTGLVRAVDEVDLDVAPGEALGIIGPSGCGKSTLLHLLGALDRPDGGRLWLGGERVDRLSEAAAAGGRPPARRVGVGAVHQGG
ncbi:MAG: ATP-binding cassette domain-containing protein, partial [Actinomadura rubrobrunea]|nr:ATP-binding cassette domain-containing protein [Actinomadura rubrobrunea]